MFLSQIGFKKMVLENQSWLNLQVNAWSLTIAKEFPDISYKKCFVHCNITGLQYLDKNSHRMANFMYHC